MLKQACSSSGWFSPAFCWLGGCCMLKCNLPHRARANLIVSESLLKQKNIGKVAGFARNVCPIHVMACIFIWNHLYHQCDPDPKDDWSTVKFSAAYFRDSQQLHWVVMDKHETAMRNFSLSCAYRPEVTCGSNTNFIHRRDIVHKQQVTEGREGPFSTQ